MSNVKSRTTTTVTVRGRIFEIERIDWKDSDGLSFDVSDQATGQALHDESFDDEPGIAEIEDLLDELKTDIERGHLDPLLVGDETTLCEILGIVDPREDEPMDMSGGSGGSTDR